MSTWKRGRVVSRPSECAPAFCIRCRAPKPSPLEPCRMCGFFAASSDPDSVAEIRIVPAIGAVVVYVLILALLLKAGGIW